MGWQSYILFYNCNEEKENIIKVIKEHNNSEDYENVGGELINICSCKIEKKYKIGIGKNYSNAIICGNGGGRDSTYKFFSKRWKFKYIPFTSSFEKRCKLLKIINIDTGEEINPEFK